ncbi:hypothetical protein [Demequina aurantiaca]|uniref:hypothetical protein n=1 Tax=Demequina aurantiaca TaxID=676200 RepID=UPI003D32E7C6
MSLRGACTTAVTAAVALALVAGCSATDDGGAAARALRNSWLPSDPDAHEVDCSTIYVADSLGRCFYVEVADGSVEEVLAVEVDRLVGQSDGAANVASEMACVGVSDGTIQSCGQDLDVNGTAASLSLDLAADPDSPAGAPEAGSSVTYVLQYWTGYGEVEG